MGFYARAPYSWQFRIGRKPRSFTPALPSAAVLADRASLLVERLATGAADRRRGRCRRSQRGGAISCERLEPFVFQRARKPRRLRAPLQRPAFPCAGSGEHRAVGPARAMAHRDSTLLAALAG